MSSSDLVRDEYISSVANQLMYKLVLKELATGETLVLKLRIYLTLIGTLSFSASYSKLA